MMCYDVLTLICSLYYSCARCDEPGMVCLIWQACCDVCAVFLSCVYAYAVWRACFAMMCSVVMGLVCCHVPAVLWCTWYDVRTVLCCACCACCDVHALLWYIRFAVFMRCAGCVCNVLALLGKASCSLTARTSQAATWRATIKSNKSGRAFS